MSSINQISGNIPLQPITNTPVTRTTAANGSEETPSGDTLELSGVNQFVQTLQANNIRADKVQDVRTQIANGTYETDDKLNSAVDELLNDITN